VTINFTLKVISEFFFKASFLSSTTLGIATTLAVILHEIPHEIGNYATFVHFGASQKKALVINILDGASSIVGVCSSISRLIALKSELLYLLTLKTKKNSYFMI
jgi:zinc and cadmium transporter